MGEICCVLACRLVQTRGYKLHFLHLSLVYHYDFVIPTSSCVQMVVTNMQNEKHKTSPPINKQHMVKYQNTQSTANDYGQ